MDSADSYLERPIVILGAPRSGTTRLGLTLGHDASLAYIHEPRLIWRYGNDSKSDMLSPQDASKHVRQYIREELARLVREAGARRLLEKTPSNSLRPEFVEKVLPGCRFIHIMRDPIDAVLATYGFWTKHAYGMKSFRPGHLRKRIGELSLRQMPFYAREAIYRLAPKPIARRIGQSIWGPRLPGIDGLLRDLEILDVCALQWRMCVESAAHFGRRLPSDRYMEVWVQDLSWDMFRHILDFCALEECEGMRGAFDQRYTRSVGNLTSSSARRRAQAGSGDIDRILRWTDSAMSLIGASSVVKDSPRGGVSRSSAAPLGDCPKPSQRSSGYYV